MESPIMEELSLRDYFAGQAMAAIIPTHAHNATYREIAEDAYAMADAMMAEHERRRNCYK